MKTSLNHLEKGGCGRVIALTCQKATARRLLELGVTPNTRIYCIRWAPMHGAIEVKIRGYLLAVGYNDAASILIEKEGG
ncbi:FeoA family protein [Anaerotignum propionicum]|uniref:FeoA family protein n=1 Tax=Anaerotignum propionicum TaxID=28446 RepID=UPI00289B0607|nr:FeoA family protein [Anaerotignum propionicum]